MVRQVYNMEILEVFLQMMFVYGFCGFPGVVKKGSGKLLGNPCQKQKPCGRTLHHLSPLMMLAPGQGIYVQRLQTRLFVSLCGNLGCVCK